MATVKPAATKTTAALPATAIPTTAKPTTAKQITAKPKAVKTKAVKAKTPKAEVAKPKAIKTTGAKKSKPPAKKPAAKKSPAAAVVAEEKKIKKPKLVRDSFTIPKEEYAALDVLKTRAIALAQPAKKSELLRAGILLLAAMDDAHLVASLKAVTVIKTGRPKK